MNNNERMFECSKCKKLYIDEEEGEAKLCLQCETFELRMIYEKEKIGVLSKENLKIQRRNLKIRLKDLKLTHQVDDQLYQKTESDKEDTYDDESSEHEEDDTDEDYIPPTPQKKTFKKKVYKKTKPQKPPKKSTLTQLHKDKPQCPKETAPCDITETIDQNKPQNSKTLNPSEKRFKENEKQKKNDKRENQNKKDKTEKQNKKDKTEKQNKKDKTQNTEKEQNPTAEHLSSDSYTDSDDDECTPGIQKHDFKAHYEGHKNYYPGQELLFRFRCGNDKEKEKELTGMLRNKMKKIKTKLLKMYKNKDIMKLKEGDNKLLCPYKGCGDEDYYGQKLGRHLKAKKGHKFKPERAKLVQSYLKHYTKHVTLLSKKGVHKPRMCAKCKTEFFDRCDLHIQREHQIFPKSREYNKLFRESKEASRKFIIEYDDYNDSSSSDSSSDSSSESDLPKKTTENDKRKTKDHPKSRNASRRRNFITIHK